MAAVTLAHLMWCFVVALLAFRHDFNVLKIQKKNHIYLQWRNLLFLQIQTPTQMYIVRNQTHSMYGIISSGIQIVQLTQHFTPHALLKKMETNILRSIDSSSVSSALLLVLFFFPWKRFIAFEQASHEHCQHMTIKKFVFDLIFDELLIWRSYFISTIYKH